MKRTCENCTNCCYTNIWDGAVNYCERYDIANSQGNDLEVEAINCYRYEYGTSECIEDDEYCPSATAGDYSPSNPWDAPGMSVRDFI